MRLLRLVISTQCVGAAPRARPRRTRYGSRYGRGTGTCGTVVHHLRRENIKGAFYNAYKHEQPRRQACCCLTRKCSPALRSCKLPESHRSCTLTTYEKDHEVVGRAPMVDQRPSLGLQLLCPHLALSLIDNLIAIRIPARRASRGRGVRRRLEPRRPCDRAAPAPWGRIDGKAGLVALTNRLPTDRRRRGQRR